MARKPLKLIQYDTITRGTNDFIPVTFMREVAVDPETGAELDEPKMVPFNLEGRVVMMTVKAKEYDAVNPQDRFNGKEAHDQALIVQWQTELKDESTPPSDLDRSLNEYTGPGPWDKDYLFRIFIDCDDPGEGAQGSADNRYQWQNNYQGMYDMDPAEGRVVFRLTKKMTMIKPGTYYFDIRLMEKMHKQIGMISESRDFAPIFGTLDIQGTPTNRATTFDWIDLTDTETNNG